MHKTLNYEQDKADMIQCVPTMFTGFPGGGNPMYKTKQDWWAPPEFLNIEYSDAAMDVMQEVLYEQIPEIVNKHSDAIAARYKKK
jgi:hypothetical protein